ncbi:hypothetical protein Q5762_33715 [Streptomyces sp. P9(2023)]|uniref:hypothetical protein n=1 Tax=Streptomyces sp. P9(2023) TaxID=3064394 RepID=UPI0028F41ACB|nr:hypothetical protein [Streptomyces sp. P9(2023)]MDT9693196.1 hypothetical protein [Streptomyces sp. P9(2023)]
MALGTVQATVGGTAALGWFATLWWLGPARRRRARRRPARRRRARRRRARRRG